MNKMIVTTLDGKFYIFDMRTFHPTKGYSHSVEKVRKYNNNNKQYNKLYFYVIND